MKIEVDYLLALYRVSNDCGHRTRPQRIISG